MEFHGAVRLQTRPCQDEVIIADTVWEVAMGPAARILVSRVKKCRRLLLSLSHLLIPKSLWLSAMAVVERHVCLLVMLRDTSRKSVHSFSFPFISAVIPWNVQANGSLSFIHTEICSHRLWELYHTDHRQAFGKDRRTCTLGYCGSGRIRQTSTIVVSRDRFAPCLLCNWLPGIARKCHGQGKYTFLFWGIPSTFLVLIIESQWYPEVLHFCPTTPIILVGLKSDLRTKRSCVELLKSQGLIPITPEQGTGVARRMGASYIECSSKEMRGVDEVFEHAVHIVVSASEDQEWATATSKNEQQTTARPSGSKPAQPVSKRKGGRRVKRRTCKILWSCVLYSDFYLCSFMYYPIHLVLFHSSRLTWIGAFFFFFFFVGSLWAMWHANTSWWPLPSKRVINDPQILYTKTPIFLFLYFTFIRSFISHSSWIVLLICLGSSFFFFFF